MIRIRMKRRSNQREAKKLPLVKETVIRFGTDDMLNYFFEMMHMSPDLFSQSLSRAKGVRPDTPGLYSAPRRLKGKSRSWCSKHFGGTPDLFFSPNCSPNRQEMNSVSLSCCSNHSLLSSSS